MYKEIYDENIMYQMVKDAYNEASRLKPFMDYYSDPIDPIKWEQYGKAYKAAKELEKALQVYLETQRRIEHSLMRRNY